jgi:hypothetical protein
MSEKKQDVSQITTMIQQNSEGWLSELLADYSSLESYTSSIEPP